MIFKIFCTLKCKESRLEVSSVCYDNGVLNLKYAKMHSLGVVYRGWQRVRTNPLEPDLSSWFTV
jgi:hypothetical protein